MSFIFTAGDPRAPSQHHPWDLSTWAVRLQGSTGQGPAISWPHLDRGQSLTFQLHLKINTWLSDGATTLLGVPPTQGDSTEQNSAEVAVYREAAIHRFCHSFYWSCWEIQAKLGARAPCGSSSWFIGDWQPSGEEPQHSSVRWGDRHLPKGSSDEPAAGLDGYLRLVSTQSKPLWSQKQLGSYIICNSTSFGNQEIISKRLILLLLFQLQRGEQSALQGM